VEGKERNGGESKVKDAGVKKVEGEIIQSIQQQG
jgi:ribosomal protein L27